MYRANELTFPGVRLVNASLEFAGEIFNRARISSRVMLLILNPEGRAPGVGAVKVSEAKGSRAAMVDLLRNFIVNACVID